MLELPKIYNDSGYLVFDEIIPFCLFHNISFVIIIGGRGTGKTYGALKYFYEHNLKFMYLRRKQVQIDMQMNTELNPFAPINKDCGYHVVNARLNKVLGGFYNGVYDDDKEKWVPDGEPIGLLGALSTFSSSRGIDGSDIKVLCFDEFLREPHEKAMKNEGDIFANVYETINRNRELKGEKPLLGVLLSNENYSESDILKNFNVYQYMDLMKDGEIYADLRRGVLFIYQKHSKISASKAKTALYKAGASERMLDMAIANTSQELKHRVKNIKPGGSAWCCIDGIGTLYRMTHNEKPILYVTSIIGACRDRYGTNAMERARLLRDKASILYYDSVDLIYYQSIDVKYKFKEYVFGL